MGKATLILIAVVSALIASAGNLRRPNMVAPPPQASEKAPTNQASGVRLTIATVGPMFGPPTDRYRVGEQVPIAIRMTNTSRQPSYACVSSDLYQDLPRLTKDGRLLPYAKWQTDQLRNAQKDQTCLHEDLPESM